ncbi:MAG: S8 family serine peptidase, partial [Gallionella sp.]
MPIRATVVVQMRQPPFSGCYLALILCLLIFAPASLAIAAIDEELVQELERLAPQERVSVIITMKDTIRAEDYRVRDRGQRNGKLVKALKHQAQLSHPRIKNYLKRRKAKKLKEFWIINGLAANVRADQVRGLAAQAGVESVRSDPLVTFNAHLVTASEGPKEWNLNVIKLPAGLTGDGVVVATMDTGVDASHPYLAGKWRGGVNSWFDPHGQHAKPYDADGHGTQVMGVIVGGSEGGTKIGVAPGAKFIAAKVFNDAGTSTYSAIHSIFQWLLDPDNDPDTSDAPDVVNASWGLPNTNNKCNIEFDKDIRLLKAAGIAVVFAGGNDGPAPATAVSPASSAGVISIGAVQYSQYIAGLYDIARFSSRGPSPCGGVFFPTLVAPGEAIYTYDLSTGGKATYTTVSGSSFATPHVSGVLTLLAGAFPAVMVADLEKAITPGLGASGDNNFGYGLLDANAAFQILTNKTGNTPIMTSLPPTVAFQGVTYIYQVVANDADADTLTYALDASPSGMSISATGLISWLPSIEQAGQQLVSVRVTDSTGLYSTQAYTLVAANAADAPVAVDDSYDVSQGNTLTIPLFGVLANDTDPKRSQLFAVSYSAASTGTLVGKSDGSFVYTPPSPDFTGIVTFKYQANNGLLNSVAAIVTINVLANTPVPLILPRTYPIDIVYSSPDYFQDDPIQEVALADERSNGEVVAKLADESEQESSQGEGRAPIFTSVPLTAAKQDVGYYYDATARVEEGSELVFSLDAAPEGMTISEDGHVSWIPNSAQVSKHLVVVRVTDSSKLYAAQSFQVVVENVNDTP